MTSITLDQISKRYAGQPRPVVEGLSLSVRPGEILALLGPSGSGKSTLLKLIAGIEAPDAGDIRFEDASVLAVPANKRGAVLMFQKAYLFPFLSVQENIAFGLKLRGAERAEMARRVQELLALIALPGIERKLPSQLSGGEQQRVALARALAVEPRLLLLDQPLSSLDTAVRQSLQEEIRRIQRRLGVTTLLVTHDLGEAMAMADRVALLLEGRIEALEIPERLFRRPPTRAAARFVGVSTFLSGRLAGGVLESPLGPLRWTEGHAGAPRTATLAIRPEQIGLAAEPGPNSAPGTVAELTFRGDYVEYQLTTAAGAVRVRSYGAERYARGDVLYLRFPPEQLFELREG